MVKYSEATLNNVFYALCDATRRAILARLSKGETQVTELAEPYDMSLPAVSKHLGVLEQAGLITREKDGRARRCTLQAQNLEEANEWLEKYRIFWEESLDRLDDYLKTVVQKEKEKGKGKKHGHKN
jgi:DNA-binding transcriptional ArsR family regulator